MAGHESTGSSQRIVRASAASIPIAVGLFVAAAVFSEAITRPARLHGDGYMLVFCACATPLAFYVSYAKRRKPIWWLPLFVWIACLMTLVFGAAFRAFGFNAAIPWAALQRGLPAGCAFGATLFLMHRWFPFFGVTTNDP